MAKRRQGVLLWRDEPTAWLAGLGRKSRRDESRRGPFFDTWGAIGLPWGRDKTAVSIVGSLDPERLDAALGRNRRRPGRALPLCLARPRALPLAARGEADARGRDGERAAAHRPRGRHAGEAAGARLRGPGGDDLRRLPGAPARRDAAGGRPFGRLAGQGTGHGGAAGRRAGAARLDGDPAGHCAAARRHHGAAPARRLGAVGALLPAACPGGVRPRRAVGSRPQGAAGDRLDPRAQSARRSRARMCGATRSGKG